MDIYDQIIKADMQGSVVRPALQELAMRPPEDRYISRIVAALGFAFGDLDSRCVGFDLETLPAIELERIRKLLKIRATQFCMLLREVLGAQPAERLLSRVAESAGTDSDNLPETLGYNHESYPTLKDGSAVYYKRDGRPCSYEEWSELMADKDYVRLQSIDLPDETVIGTVWLGVDGRSFYLRPPHIDQHLIFYTTISFPKHGKMKRANKYFRYATEQEARDGHEAAVRRYGARGKTSAA